MSDPYTYPGTDVLINKRGIRDGAILHKFEHQRVSLRIAELAENPIQGKFDLDHIKAIHGYLFQDVYEWAGKQRKVFLQKGDTFFSHPKFIASYWKTENDKLQSMDFFKGLNKSQFTDAMANHYAEINSIHPFAEGNGRSTRVYLDQLAKGVDFKLDYTKVSKKDWNNAAIMSSRGDVKPMIEVFNKIAAASKAISFDQDSAQVALNKHPSLKSAFHALTSAESYSERTINDPAARKIFVGQVRDNIRATLAEGKDIPVPKAQAPSKGLSR